MKCVAIVQARMGSTRLPGKVLLDIAGRPMLAHVVERARLCREVDDVIVATSTHSNDDEIVSACRRLDVRVFRGSESDVLDRYAGAAAFASADSCVRITADCPLLDPGVSDRIVSAFKTARPPVDYASNKIPQSFPRGLDTEVFTRAALERARREAVQPHHRIHVTPYLYENPASFRLLSITSDVDRNHWRWTVDCQADLEFVRAVHEHFRPRTTFSWAEVVELVESHPALMEINKNVTQKNVMDG
jgi:spore coat polysaccharide biosynthesis protein SpsF